MDLSRKQESVGGSPLDYQAKDQRIKELKEHIDALDEDVRRIRTNPEGQSILVALRERVTMESINKALDNYLKQLDQQRNDLRREKWRLEGR